MKKGTRRPKTFKVPRTRANGEWTEASFWGFLRGVLREGCKKWPPHVRHAKEDARYEYHGKNPNQKWVYLCSMCFKMFKGSEVHVDHVIPCGVLKSFADLPAFVEKMFCEKDGLKVVCKPCHEAKTAAERLARKPPKSDDTLPLPF